MKTLMLLFVLLWAQGAQALPPYAKAENFSGTVIEVIAGSSSEYTYYRIKLDKGYDKKQIDAVHRALKKHCKCKFNRQKKPREGEALLAFRSGLGKKPYSKFRVGEVFVFKSYVVKRPDASKGREDMEQSHCEP